MTSAANGDRGSYLKSSADSRPAHAWPRERVTRSSPSKSYCSGSSPIVVVDELYQRVDIKRRNVAGHDGGQVRFSGQHDGFEIGQLALHAVGLGVRPVELTVDCQDWDLDL